MFRKMFKLGPKTETITLDDYVALVYGGTTSRFKELNLLQTKQKAQIKDKKVDDSNGPRKSFGGGFSGIMDNKKEEYLRKDAKMKK